MSFLTFGLTQTLTLWVLTGVDAYNKPSFAAPVQRICRWEERTTRLENAEGQVVLARSRIFLAEDVAIGDFIAFGTIATADPRQVLSARAVLEFRKTPSLGGDSFERKCYL